MTPAAYLRAIFGLTLGFTAAIVAVNVGFDPYGLRNRASAGPDAPSAREEDTGEFWRKALAVRAVRPQTILLGTSRAAVGLNARHAVFQAGDQPVLNLALGGCDVDQMRLLLVHAHATSGIKRAVIGLDLESFVTSGRPDFDAAALAGNPQSDPAWAAPARIAVSRDVFWSAMTGALKTATAKAPHRGESTAADPSAQNEALIRSLEGQRGLIWLAEFNNFYSRLPHLFPYWRPGQAWSSDARRAGSMQAFRELLAYAREHDIELQLFISPVHARYLEWYRRVGWWPLFEAWKRELVAAIDQSQRPSSSRATVALWDFSGFNAVTTETVPRIGDLTTRMQWYLESSHYSARLGNLMLERMLAADKEAESPLPRTRIDPGNIERHLSLTLSDADRYRLTHRGEIANIGQMVEYLRRIARK